jgi:hypothetical protein
MRATESIKMWSQISVDCHVWQKALAVTSHLRPPPPGSGHPPRFKHLNGYERDACTLSPGFLLQSAQGQPPEGSDRCIAVVNKICFLFGRRPLETGAGRVASRGWVAVRSSELSSLALTFDDPIRSDRRQGDELINCTICTRPPGAGWWGSQ